MKLLYVLFLILLSIPTKTVGQKLSITTTTLSDVEQAIERGRRGCDAPEILANLKLNPKNIKYKVQILGTMTWIECLSYEYTRKYQKLTAEDVQAQGLLTSETVILVTPIPTKLTEEPQLI